jgi:hypothetical protein
LRAIGTYHDHSLTRQDDAEPEPFHAPTDGPEFSEAVDQERRNLANIANASRAELTLAALRAIAARVADISGRKNLVWLTADLPIAGGVAARVLHDSNLALYPVDARGLTASFNPHYALKGLAALQDLAEQTLPARLFCVARCAGRGEIRIYTGVGESAGSVRDWTRRTLRAGEPAGAGVATLMVLNRSLWRAFGAGGRFTHGHGGGLYGAAK